MKKTLQLFLLALVFLCSCDQETQKSSIEKWKQEIRDTEQKFAEMVKENGIREAFLTFAAEDAVLMRNNSVVVGKNAITEFYDSQKSIDGTLSWTPDFVDVAASGDLAYTYGKYTFSYLDENHSEIKSTGIFHTVWKRQADGNWRFVWD
ncbi:MAG: nuclear transport factor 2 family protein [Bacteroidetes bacterium]|jgi:ketosteroid isomerase-like protein|nr:nuclear transport factor 2 family protein [Bacteroidota bacterium]MBT6686424.1 nuclear transport factor 2 family protein [Bacteroidota bacterium]MBT7144663.1 nuclear transport factor 2 family protein [Bacteroidota bacterium]MBT7491302.1 nuclear transport factor 2 family protein [Bacteroidota bacterium]